MKASQAEDLLLHDFLWHTWSRGLLPPVWWLVIFYLFIWCRGEISRKWKLPITGFYYGLLRILWSFITDIRGLFLRILLNLNQDPKKAPETLIFEKTLEKSRQFITDITEYYGYYGNCYYGILRNITVVISPPCLNAWVSFKPPQKKIGSRITPSSDPLHWFSLSLPAPYGEDILGANFGSVATLPLSTVPFNPPFDTFAWQPWPSPMYSAYALVG